MRQFHLGGQIRSGGAWQPGAMEYALLGDAAAAGRAIAGWRGFTTQRPMFVAYCYGTLGDATQASAWLEKAYAARDPQIIWLKIDPRFAKVRGDARIAGLIARLGLQQASGAATAAPLRPMQIDFSDTTRSGLTARGAMPCRAVRRHEVRTANVPIESGGISSSAARPATSTWMRCG